MNVFCTVEGQKLSIVTPLRHFAQGSDDFVKFLFTFSEDWNGLMTFAQFRQNNNIVNKYMSNETVDDVTYKTVTLPSGWEPGPLTMTLYGTGRETVVGTTNYVLMMIDETGFVADGVTSEIVETLYEQLVNRFIQYEWCYDIVKDYQGAWEALTAALDDATAWEEVPVTPSGTAPASPSDGDYWWDSTNSLLKKYSSSDSDWVTISGRATGTSAPPDVFYYMDTTVGHEKLYQTPVYAIPPATASTIGGFVLDSTNFKMGTGTNAGKLMLNNNVTISGDFTAQGNKKVAVEAGTLLLKSRPSRDLDDYKTTGYYILEYQAPEGESDYTHLPVEDDYGHRIILVNEANPASANSMRFQFYYNLTTKKVYTRIGSYSSSTYSWTSWKEMSNNVDTTLARSGVAADAAAVGTAIATVGTSITTINGTLASTLTYRSNPSYTPQAGETYDNDYDNFTDPGYYAIGVTKNIKNDPLGADQTGRRFLFVTGKADLTARQQILFHEENKRLFIRAGIAVGTQPNVELVWQSWKEIGDLTGINSLLASTLTYRSNPSYTPQTGETYDNDYDNFSAPGYYVIGNNAVLKNDPLGTNQTGRRVLIVVSGGSDNAKYQILFNEVKKRLFIRARVYSDGAWGWQDWGEIGTPASTISTINGQLANALTFRSNPSYTPQTGETYVNDYDNFSGYGYYTIGSGKLVKNGPLGVNETGRRVLLVASGGSDNAKYQILFHEEKKRLFIRARVYSGGAWGWQAWKEIGAPAEISFNEAHIGTLHEDYENHITNNTGTAVPEGTEIRVMAYNVAKYTNDTDTTATTHYLYEYKDKLLNFRRLLATVDADYLLIQEDAANVYVNTTDATQNKSSMEWLYQPLYPTKNRDGKGTIHSKKALPGNWASTDSLKEIYFYYDDGTGNKKYSWNVSRAKYTVDGETFIVYSVHMPTLKDSANAGPITGGAFGYHASQVRIGLFNDFVSRVIAAEDTAPKWWVAGGDFNASYPGDPTAATEAERPSEVDKLLAYCEANNLHVSNGGYFGLFVTHPNNGKAIDFIVSSPNTVIRNAAVLGNWFSDLYSDHLPQYADIVLLPDET